MAGPPAGAARGVDFTGAAGDAGCGTSNSPGVMPTPIISPDAKLRTPKPSVPANMPAACRAVRPMMTPPSRHYEHSLANAQSETYFTRLRHLDRELARDIDFDHAAPRAHAG